MKKKFDIERVPESKSPYIAADVPDEVQIRLKKALDTLSDMELKVLEMKAFQHMTNKTIADELCLSTSSVATLLRRAKQKCKDVLK